jgi:eukaryotic-like serine/threonine-protein kinase
MSESQRCEGLVEEFELAWQRGEAPEVGAFLRTRATEKLDAREATTAALHELIAVDLEWRWKHARRGGESGKTIDDYWRDLASLGPREQIPLTLVAEEYRVRTQWGDRPSHDSIIERFPTRAAELRRRFVEVDGELSVERGDRGAFPSANSLVEGGSASPAAAAGSLSPPVGADWARFQDYLLHEMIGAGQTGRVYRATHLPSNQPVAVKYLRKIFHHDRRATERFLEEARLASKLAHPGLVPIRRVGRSTGGGYFLEMELLAGPDLARVAAAGRVTVENAVRWTCQAAETIAHAHAVGIVHCDLKPGNLVLDAARRVRVTEFGLARTLDGNGVAVGNRIAGTAPYMAPEQVCEWWGKIGPAADVYGLGAVLYALLAGGAPFAGATVADVLARVVSGATPAPLRERRPEVSTKLTAIVNRALSKSPSDRYASVAEMAIELRAI